MNINNTFIELFYESSADIKALVECLTEEDWLKNQFRQKTFEVHKQTNSIVYIWSSHYDNLEIQIKEDENRLSQAVYSYANKIKSCYKPDSIITKLMIVKMPAKSIIPEHTDLGNLGYIHRCHYVIKTNRMCTFTINDHPYWFKEGSALEINNIAPHSVENNGSTDRVHLICDILEM